MQMNYENGYQNWKNVINNVLIWKYVKKQLDIQNQEIKQKIIQIQKLPNKTQEVRKKYLSLVKQIGTNCSNINERIKQCSENQQLLNQLYKEHNIQVNYQAFEKWIKDGKKIDI